MLNLTAADMAAISSGDSNYINNKGAKCYCDEDYGMAVEYYHLAASMGNVNSVSNLGYCYLYGRAIEQNISLAIAYFKVAAARKSVDAAYKLGDIYGSDKWVMKDKELSIYYYRIALSHIIGTDCPNEYAIRWNENLIRYPSLCYALGREMSNGESMPRDINLAYLFLKKAEEGYERCLANGDKMYEKSYNGVMELLADSEFDPVRDKYNDEDDSEED